ncbi:MAG: S-layer homology domain-containing protein, partial [Clostridium sp.]|nr:S-layer homology domain-containing protein [Clostridium sp.]
MKKFIAIIMAVIMVMSFATIAFAANGFTDVSKSRYEAAIDELYDLGIVNGYSATKFGTDYTLTRAEACAIIVRALYGEKTVPDVINFTDVSYRDWFYDYINTAVYYDIMHGHNATTFAPNDEITYDQMATLILNALGYNAPQLAGEWPVNVERMATRLGLYTNIPIYFDGSEYITRGEACQMLYNALDCYVVEYVRGRIIETDQTLYEAMGFEYEPEYIYTTGIITDLVDVSDYYHTNTYYYLITLNDYNTYFVNSNIKLDVKDYIEIYTDKKTIYHSDYLWAVSYIVKTIIPVEPTKPDVEGTISYIGENNLIVDDSKEVYTEIKINDTTYFVLNTSFKAIPHVGDTISLNLYKVLLTNEGETINFYK